MFWNFSRPLRCLPRMLYGRTLIRLALSKQLRASGDQIAAAGGGFTKAIPKIQQENCVVHKSARLYLREPYVETSSHASRVTDHVLKCNEIDKIG